MKKLIYINLIILCFSSCESYNPFVPKSFIDELIEYNRIKPVENVALIYNNDVYFFPDFNFDAIKITNSPNKIKRQIKISHDYSKIAYLNEFGSPIIIDLEGNEITSLDNFINVTDFNWSFDDQTLYMLIDNEVHYYGPSINIPSIEFEALEEIISLAITKDNTVLYIVKTPLGIGRFDEKLVIKNLNNERIIENSEGLNGHMRKVILSSNEEHFILSYSSSFYDKSYNGIALYLIPNSYPERVFNSNFYIDPLYDDYSEFLITADNKNSNNEYYPSATYLGLNEPEESPNIYHYQYTEAAGSIYLDMK